jgi:protocatechuate 3,4-dioxygenase beta subunit
LEHLERRTLLAAISGTVFLDANGNGLREDGEPGLAEWRVYVDGNANNAFDEGERSALTNDLGHYTLRELSAGTHRVREVEREGFTRTAPGGNGTHEVTVGADGAEDGVHFGNREDAPAETASVRGVVFDDANGDGVWQDGEPPLANWVVYLDANNNAQRDDGERAATTNGDGRYAFEDLAGGTYRVREALPEGWTIVRPGEGFYLVELSDGQAANERIFANRRTDQEPPPSQEAASIRGMVFDDRNGDGVRQDGEPPLADWVVYLDQDRNGRRDDGERAAATNGDGRYAFEGLAAGSYRVREVLPPGGWTVVRPGEGFYDLNLADGQAANERHFANRRPPGEEPPAPQLATIRGVVFDDLNGDGTWQDGEAPLGGWVVYLDTNANGQRDDGERGAVTSSTGGYAFEGVEPGTYRVREVLPQGWTVVRPGEGFHVVTVAAGQTAGERVFANRRTGEEPAPASASVRGLVFNDLNGDGAWQDGEAPLGGRVIYLDANGNGQRDDGERAAETNGDGRYAFEDLAAGTYHVREVLPAGWTITRPAGGFYEVSLADGQRADERLFGNRLTDGDPPVGAPPAADAERGTISGAVFDDLDLDGQRDAGEPGVRGARVFLDANDNGRRDRREARAVTDAAGTFTFADVPAGRHVVKHLGPRGFRPTAIGGSADQAAIDLAAGAHASAPFGVTRLSLLQGMAFHDANRNRAADVGEAVHVGMTVFLDLNRNGALDAAEPTALTDAAGRYAFVVPRGSYRVGEVMPDGIVTSKVKIGQGRVVNRDLVRG